MTDLFLLPEINNIEKYLNEWNTETVDVVNMPDGRRLLPSDIEFHIPSLDGDGFVVEIPEYLDTVSVLTRDLYPNFKSYMLECHGVEIRDV